MPPKRPTPTHDNEPKMTNREDALPSLLALPSLERIQQELGSAANLNDFLAKMASLRACLPIPSSRCLRLN